MAQKVTVIDGKGPVNLKLVRKPEPGREPSLLAKIRVAKTVEAVDALLADRRLYPFASAKTRARWWRAAEVRKAELSKPKENSK